MSSKTKTTGAMEDSTPALVPKLRFPEFREAAGWKGQTGNALFDQINDRNPEPGLHVLAITQEHGAIPRHLIDYHVSVTEKSIESYKVVRVGDFIISLRSFQGGIEYSQYHGICSPAYVILRLHLKDVAEYFRHYFKTERFIGILTKNLEGLRDGKMISYAQFSELLISVPSPPEQQRIAECLSSVDELIAAQGRKLDALKTHKKGLMQQLFPREDETQPRLRFPEFQNAGEWEPRKAGTLFANRVTKGEQGLPIYSVTMHDGMVKRDSLDRNFYDIEDAARNKKVCKEDIAYNMMRMWQGALGVAPEDCLVSPAYIVLAPMKDAVPTFFQYLFKLPATILLLTSHSRGLTKDRLRLYYDDFASIPLQCPAPPEQQRIASCLTGLDVLITAELQKLEALKTHKKGLMQQLFPAPAEVEA
ncbi:restriction endonuclease subunit S [Pseudomonas sp. MDT1-85]